MENKNTKSYNTAKRLNAHIGVQCIICNEVVNLTEHEVEMIDCGIKLPPKICDNCKKAILYVRSHMPEE